MEVKMKLLILKMIFLLAVLLVTFSQADMVAICVGQKCVSISSKISNLKEYPIVVAIIGVNPMGKIQGELIKSDTYIPSYYRGCLYWVSQSYYDTTGISFITSSDVKKYFKMLNTIDTTILSPIHLLDNENQLYGRNGSSGIPDSVPVDSLEYIYTIYKHGNAYSLYKSKQIFHMANGKDSIEVFKSIVETKKANVKKAVRKKSIR